MQFSLGFFVFMVMWEFLMSLFARKKVQLYSVLNLWGTRQARYYQRGLL